MEQICSFCGRKIDRSEDVKMVYRFKESVRLSHYLCQDCILESSIYIENLMSSPIPAEKSRIVKQRKIISSISSYKDKKQDEAKVATKTLSINPNTSEYAPKLELEKTKKEVFDIVSKKVKHQDNALKQIIRTLYFNLCIDDPTFKDNILLIGNTGVGKTFSVTSILEAWSIPYVIADCNSFSEVGYIGDSVDSAVERLYNVCNKDATLASHGVIVFDEVDKLRASNTYAKDVSGESVQEELLTLITGKNVQINSSTSVNTSYITFIFMGAFDDVSEEGKLSAIREKRIKRSNSKAVIGFTETVKKQNKPVILDYTADDLNEYGIIHQLSGRFSEIIELNSFDEMMCEDIIFNSDSSKLKHIVQKFNMLGLSLEIPDSVIKSFSKYIVEFGTGARGITQYLNNIFNPILKDVEDEIDEGNLSHNKCTILDDIITDPSKYVLE